MSVLFPKELDTIENIKLGEFLYVYLIFMGRHCFRVNLDKLNGEATILLPNLFVNCTYDVDGRLMVVPLQGQGIFRGNISKPTLCI